MGIDISTTPGTGQAHRDEVGVADRAAASENLMDDLSLEEIEIKRKAKRRMNRYVAVTIVATVVAVACAFFAFGFYQPYFPEGPDKPPRPAWRFALVFSASIVGAVMLLVLTVAFALFAFEHSQLEADVDVARNKMRLARRFAAAPEAPPRDSTPETRYFERLVELNVEHLGGYYWQVKVHTNKSFSASLIVGLIGIFLLFGGLIAAYADTSRRDVAFFTACAGLITEFIAAVFFYLYNSTVKQLKGYHDSLLDVQNVLLSFKIVGETPSGPERLAMVKELLSHLIAARKQRLEGK